MPHPSILDFSESVLLLRRLGFPGGVVRRPEPTERIHVRRRIRDLHIGLDLGTSCSKVAIGDPEAGVCFPVRFSDARKGIGRYLLPTRFEEWGGKVLLGEERTSGCVDDIKWRAITASRMGDDLERTTEDLAIYLALVLGVTLDGFKSQLASQYADSEICWHLNLGFPARAIEGALVALYRSAAEAAIGVVSGGGVISRARVADQLHRPGRLRGASEVGLDSDRVNLYPEIAAQLAGYVRSRYREYGSVLFVDVGAGTLDVSTLIIHRVNHADRCTFHFCDVKPLGALHLYRERRSRLRSHGVDLLRTEDPSFRDGLSPLPEELADFLKDGVGATPVVRRDFNEVSEDFSLRCRRACLGVLAAFRQSQREIHADAAYDPWPTALRCIRAGGGSRMEFFRTELSTRLEEDLIPFTKWHPDERERRRNGQGLAFTPLPMPDDLQTEDTVVSQEFDRLSVAHGLAYGADNLMEVTGALVGGLRG